MKNVSILKRDFTAADWAMIDGRILAAMNGWRVELQHKDKTVDIPGTWGAIIYPYKYFEVYKKSGSPNPGEEENEIQCYLSCGWKGMDDEVVIVLTILGHDVLKAHSPVNAEIYHFSSDKAKVFLDNELITDFIEKYCWFFKRDVHKAWAQNV